jgi:hypothetical protein
MILRHGTLHISIKFVTITLNSCFEWPHLILLKMQILKCHEGGLHGHDVPPKFLKFIQNLIKNIHTKAHPSPVSPVACVAVAAGT